MKDDDRPVFGVETCERAIELVAIGDRAGRIGLAVADEGLELDLDRTSAAPTNRNRSRR